MTRSAWIDFRLAYCYVMGDEVAPLLMHLWRRDQGVPPSL